MFLLQRAARSECISHYHTVLALWASLAARDRLLVRFSGRHLRSNDLGEIRDLAATHVLKLLKLLK